MGRAIGIGLTAALAALLACCATAHAEEDLPPGAVARLGTARLRHTGAVTGLAWAPNGHVLLSAGADGEIRWWDPPTGEVTRTIVQPSESLTCFTLSPDGNQVAEGLASGAVRLRDIATGLESQLPSPALGLALSCRYSPDGRFLAILGTGALLQPELALYEFEKHRVRGRLPLGSFGTGSFAWTPKGDGFALGDADKTVRLFELPSGRMRARLKGSTGRPSAVAFSPDGSLLACGGRDGGLALWDVTGESPTARAEAHEGQVLGVAFSPDGGRIATWGADGSIRLWGAKDLAPLCTMEASSNEVSHAAFSPDGATLAAASGAEVQFWDVATGTSRFASDGHSAEVTCIAFSRDGLLVATGSLDRSLRVWRRDGAGPPRVLRGPRSRVLAVALSRKADTVACGDGAGVVHVWDLASSDPPTRIEGHAGPVWGVAFSPDGSLVASAGEDGEVHVAEAATGALVKELVASEDCLLAVAFAPDGRSLWSGDLGLRIREWDTATWERRRQLNGKWKARSMAFSADGLRVAVAGWTGQVRAWELSTREELLKHDAGPQEVVSIALSTDGRTLAAVGANSDACLFEVATGQGLDDADLMDTGMASIAFSPDGRLLATGMRDSSVLLWRVPPAAPPEDTPPRVESAWEGLLSADASHAYAAVWALADAPKEAIPFLSEHLVPVRFSDEAARELLARLEEDEFAEREEAEGALARLMPAVEPFLRDRLRDGLPPESAARVEAILRGRTPKERLSGETLRALRAIHALEEMGTAEALAILEDLAKGEASAPETRAAAEALARRSRTD